MEEISKSAVDPRDKLTANSTKYKQFMRPKDHSEHSDYLYLDLTISRDDYGIYKFTRSIINRISA